MTKADEKIITNALKKVAKEETEFIILSGENEGRMISKAEAVARLLFKMALGTKEEIITDKGEVITKFKKPSLSAIDTIINRLEGRPVSTLKNKTKDINNIPDITDSLSKKSVQHINEVGRMNNG